MLFICPKAGECKYICGSSHDKPHNQKDGCIGYPLQGCPACIPVPSTPASVSLPPDELLTDEESFNLGFKTSYKAESTELFAYSEGVQDGAKAQLLKCHQSESNIEEQLTEIVCSQYTRAEKAEARIKELEKQIHDMASGDVIREARIN